MSPARGARRRRARRTAGRPDRARVRPPRVAVAAGTAATPPSARSRTARARRTGGTARPARPVADRARGAAPGLRASPGSHGAARGTARARQWLRRPLTSLHLILGVFGLLTLFGLVMVLSASSVESYAAERLVVLGVRQAADVLRARARPVLGRAAHPAAEAADAGRAAAADRHRAARRRARSPGSARCAAARGRGSRSGRSRCSPRRAVKVALTLWGAHVLALRRNVLHRWKHALSPVVPVSLLIFVLLIAAARPRHDRLDGHGARRAAVLRGRAAAADGRC